MAGFSVNIGADTKQLTAGIKKAEADLVAFGDVVEGSILEAKLSVNRLKAELISLGPAARESEAGKFLASELKIVTGELKAMEAQAGLTAGGTNNLFKQAFGGLRTIANIIPGIGIAGLLAFATEPIMDYITALFNAGEESKKVKESVEKMKSGIESAFSSTAQEATHVGVLVAALKNETETRERKLAAIKELQGLAPENFRNLKLEGEAVVGLDNAYKSYLDNLKNVIAVKIQQAQLEQLIEKLLKKQGTSLVGAQSLGTIESAKKSLKQLQDLQKQGQVVDPTQLKLLECIINNETGDVDDLNNQIAVLFNNIKEISKGVKINENNGNKKVEDSLAKQLSLIEKIRDAQKELQGRMFDLKEIDEATDKLSGLEQKVGDLKLKIAVRDAKKAGLPPEEIEKLKEAIKIDTEKRLNDAFEKEALLLEFSTKLKFSEPKRAEIPDDIDSRIAKATGFDKKILQLTIPEVRLKFESAGLKFRTPAALLNAFEEGAKEFEIQARKILQNAVTDAFTGIGESLGEGIGKGDFVSGIKKAGESLLQVIGSVIADIGKQTIIASQLVITLQRLLESTGFGPGSLAAGITLVAIGTAIKNIKFNTPKFAAGGIVTGPIIGQVGEMHRPEVIMPLDRLPQMLRSIGGGGGNDWQLIPIINNEGLYLAAQKGARRAGRKF